MTLREALDFGDQGIQLLGNHTMEVWREGRGSMLAHSASHTALYLYCLLINLNFWRAGEQGSEFGNLLLVGTTRLETSLICLTVPETDSHNLVTRTVYCRSSAKV